VGAHVVAWRHTLDQNWSAVRFGDVTVETTGEQHVIAAEVYLDDLAPQAVRVEVYADGVNGGSPVRQEMTRGQPLMGAAGGWLYSTRVSADRPASDYTARVIPQHSGVAVPLEEARILWQR
jgi:starch phosphorylase